jgi:CheY-like chemotaxis protein
MSDQNFNVEITKSTADKLYSLLDLRTPATLNNDAFSNLADKLKEKIDKLKIASGSPEVSSPVQSLNLTGIDNGSSPARQKSVLIVDDLGIITYQLDILFKKINFDVVISHEVYDAIETFKKRDFGYAIIDLFIPTEREGLILLDELKKLSLLCKLNTRIIVMTASSKPEYETKCLNRGADFFIEKSPGWQKKILDACLEK